MFVLSNEKTQASECARSVGPLLIILVSKFSNGEAKIKLQNHLRLITQFM